MALTHKTQESSLEREQTEKKKDNSVSDILHEFAENTSAHGLAGTVRENTKLGQVVWLVIFSVAFIANLVHLAFLIQRYLQYPTQDVTSVSS